jgi:hypothetical protein
VLIDLAVAVADGAQTISDIAVLVDQPELFGPVASDSTCWRVLDAIGTPQLAAIHRARAAARELVWAQRAEVTGSACPPACAGGRQLSGLVIDLDATIVVCHSDKEQTAPTFKHTFGYHPMVAFLDNTGEALAGMLRAGNAGANTAADHISVLDAALAQIPDAYSHGSRLLVRTDTAGCTKAFLTHIRRLRQQEVASEFSVGWAITDRERAAIAQLPATAWTAAIDTTGDVCDVEQVAVAELTGLLSIPANYPDGMRIIVRRERPHPGAQLDAFEERDGYRYTAHATDTPDGQLAHLDARHRAHARIEDRIRCGKNTGLGHFPSRVFSINAAWLGVVLLATDLLAWTQTLLLTDHPDLTRAEPKTLRYRLLHTAARITRGQRRTWLRIPHNWPWAAPLAAAFTRLATLPIPQT